MTEKEANFDLSAIVVNYNAGTLLRRCVDSLLHCPLNIEIIIVDNASTDGSLDLLTGLPQLKIIRSSQNLGFATACNAGTRQASSQSLLFLNPDCHFQPGAIGRLLGGLYAEENVGMVGGVLSHPDGVEQAGGRRAVPTPWRSFVRAFGLVRFSKNWPRLFFDFYLHRQPLPEKPIEIEAVSGACMMVKRDAMINVGEWDEGYFLHCEDLDWCMRFRQRGWKIMFIPDAKIIHSLGGCSSNRPIFVEWNKHKGMVRFYRKFFRHQYPGVLMLLVMVGVWFRFSIVASNHGLRILGRMFRFAHD